MALAALLAAPILTLGFASASTTPQEFAFRKGDHISLLGNGIAERMQHDGWLEARLQSRFPDLELSFRNLGFSADELSVSQRTSKFGSWDEHLRRCETDVVFAFFGFNESFAGTRGVEKFERDLALFVDHSLVQNYHRESPARLVLFSSPAFENLGDPNLPDGEQRNLDLRLYNRATKKVAEQKGVPFVDLYQPMAAAYAASNTALTINGIHCNSEGNRALARAIESGLLPEPSKQASKPPQQLDAIRNAVQKKNQFWFNRYRATDGYNVYGGRSSLKFTDDVTNFTVLQREMQILDAMCAAQDRWIWDLAKGIDRGANQSLRQGPDYSEVPAPLEVVTNKAGKGEAGQHLFLSGEEALSRMSTAPGMQVNLFADESMFPELVNPVQMAWDTRGRLWVAVWATYTHWRPDQPMNDKLLILEDTDADGRADRCTVFADDLHNPTGFEFWNGGVLLASVPDLLFLQDRDGDDRVDHRERILHGLSSGDTHHSANSFVLGPDGALYFQEGTFHQSQIETIYGPERSHNACVWRFEPRTRRVERFIAYNFANPHGHVFDRWGQNFMTDGTGNVNYYALPFSGRVIHPDKHRGYFSFFKQRSRPCAGTEILSSEHFPEENQGNLLICNVIGFQGLFQYRFEDQGSGFTAVEVEPLVSSTDINFRPSDVECGPDGAVYFLDWQNPLIGHMQHHIRDPSRDKVHGRVYRVSFEGRPLSRPVALFGRPIAELLEALRSPEDRVRSRARIELSGRRSEQVLRECRGWVASLDSHDSDHEHHLLEALWLHQQHNAIDLELLRRVLRSPEPRARAAATRVLRGMRHKLPEALDLLLIQIRDEHPRVRLEALVAASYFDEGRAANVALEVLRRPRDKFIDYALGETMRTLEPFWKAAIRAGEAIAADNPAGLRYILNKVSEVELAKLPRTPEVLHALMTRHGVPMKERQSAALALAQRNGSDVLAEVMAAVHDCDQNPGLHQHHVLHDLGMMLQTQIRAGSRPDRGALLKLLGKDAGPVTRPIAWAALMASDGDCEAAWRQCSNEASALNDFLRALPMIDDAKLRATNYERVRALMFHLPQAMRRDASDGTAGLPGLSLSYFPLRIGDAKLESMLSLSPASKHRVPGFELKVPGTVVPDAFALIFRGSLHIPKSGQYTFFTNSDDGSMLYLDGNLTIDNNGSHGMRERSATISLNAGAHAVVLTYYDQGGGQGLQVSWQGPGIEKQTIPPARLTTDDRHGLRDAAVRAMAHIPGHSAEKLQDAAKLVGEGRLLDATVMLLERIPEGERPADKVRPLLASIAAYASGLRPELRTTPPVLAALEVGKKLASALPEKEAAQARETLRGLGGTTLLIRTIPHQMLYDRKEIAIEAGRPTVIVFQNNDLMPHNLVITKPGTMERVGELAEGMVGDRAAELAGYVPDSPDVLFATRLLFPGETAELRFVAPTKTGEYNFVCTFPGHWRVMNGVLYVVESLDDVQLAEARAAPKQTAPARRFVKMWNSGDLDGAFAEGWEQHRDLDRGAQLFRDVGCAKCHIFAGKGPRDVVDLTDIATKYGARETLQHLLEPSNLILEGHENQILFTEAGDTIVGKVIADDGEFLTVVPDLQNPDQVLRVAKQEIELIKKAKTSGMPTGLLVTMDETEIQDLIAFLRSGVSPEKRK